MDFSSSFSNDILDWPGFLLDDRVGGADCAEDEEEGTEHKLGVVQTFGLGSESWLSWWLCFSYDDYGDGHGKCGDGYDEEQLKIKIIVNLNHFCYVDHPNGASCCLPDLL